ncbi:hypothetical protein SAMN06265380_10556 [Ruegeria faecimaris]|uniref:Uncharacterized protein n=1 Tax=Ruegeria faecimaris TaxID=686389 RepID=A0A521DAA1_9RHOB|nr:hypothetical protein SAMN06265380_10556 [Ruegeria faecimaris]
MHSPGQVHVVERGDHFEVPDVEIALVVTFLQIAAVEGPNS